MVEELTQEQKQRLAVFDPNKPCIIKPNEVEGLENFAGKFVFRRPTVKDRIDIAIQQAKLKQNTQLDVMSENLAYIVATFSVVCTEKPADFSFDAMYDVDALYGLYGRYSDWLECFRLSIQMRKADTSKPQQ